MEWMKMKSYEIQYVYEMLGFEINQESVKQSNIW